MVLQHVGNRIKVHNRAVISLSNLLMEMQGLDAFTRKISIDISLLVLMS